TTQQNRFTFQVAENSTIKKMENEIRFQMNTNHNTSTPLSTEGAYAGKYTINVADAFNGGPAQNKSNTKSRSFQLADQLRGQFKNGKLQVNSGVQIDYNSDSSFSESNYAGTFNYSSLRDYCLSSYRSFGAFNVPNCENTRAPVLPDSPSFHNHDGPD